jgi:hypothetical protein
MMPRDTDHQDSGPARTSRPAGFGTAWAPAGAGKRPEFPEQTTAAAPESVVDSPAMIEARR